MKKFNILLVTILTFFIWLYKVNAETYSDNYCKYTLSSKPSNIVYIYDVNDMTKKCGDGGVGRHSKENSNVCIVMEVSGIKIPYYDNINFLPGSCPNEIYIRTSKMNNTTSISLLVNKVDVSGSTTLEKYTLSKDGQSTTKTTNTTTSSSTTKLYNTGDLTSNSSCSTSKDGKTCCYEYNSDDTKYFLRVDAKRNGNSSGQYTNTTLTLSKYGESSKLYVSSYSSIKTDDFKSSCPKKIYGFGEKGPGQNFYSIALFTDESTRNTGFKDANNRAMTSRGAVKNGINFNLVTGSTSTDPTTTTNPTTTDPTSTTEPTVNSGYSSNGTLVCCYQSNDAGIKLTIDGDFITTQVTSGGITIAKKDFTTDDFKNGCVSSIGGFRTTAHSNDYQYYLYSHSFNTDSTYIEESNAARGANGGFKYNTLTGSLAFNLTNSCTGSGSYAPAEPSGYVNTHETEDISDSKTYKSLPSSGTVSCGSDKLGIKGMPVRIVKIISTIITVLYIAVPILLIILGMIDLGKAVVGQKDDEIQKGKRMFIKRLVSAALVFFVIFFVKMAVRFVNNATDNDSIMSCVDCFISGRCNKN